MRVLLVDEHPVVIEGLRTVLSAADDVEIVGDAASVQEAITRTLELRPDVVVLDVHMPDGCGVEACRVIREQLPGTGVLMLTGQDDDRALFDAIMAGASGYMRKHARPADLVAAIRRVGAGESILDPSVTRRVLQRVRSPEEELDPKLAELTRNELRIVELIAEGKTNRQIADEVHLAEKTVKNYVSNALHKLGAARRAEAAVYYAEHRPRV